MAMATTSTMFKDSGIPSIAEVQEATPIVTLFASSLSHNEDKSEDEMSEAQRKAASIKASLSNPFEKVVI